MLGAKVNGKIVELSYNVQNGEIVEILTSGASHGPSRDWLKIAKTSEARNKIRQWYKKEKKEENIQHGRDDLERELRRNGVMLNDKLREEVFSPTIKRLGLKSVEELYAAVGYGGVTIAKILPKIKDEYIRITRHLTDNGETVTIQKKQRSPSGVIVDGLDNCLVKFAGCCSPLPGDEIIGFVTRGFGVSVHKIDCVNVANLSHEDVSRLIGVHWDIDENESFLANLNINAVNRIGLVADITSQLAAMRVMISGLNAREQKDKTALISLAINVRGLDHLNSVIARLNKIKGVIEIVRGAN
jgi:GTP pyrophosphokinase